MTNRLPALRAVAFVFLSLLLILISAPNVLGQSTTTGTVAGTITDASGAAVGGANVKITDPTTSDTRITVTNDSGRYIFANITPGTYNVVITKAGFRTERFSDQVVNVGTTLTLNAAMEVGAVSQTVEVTASNADLQTSNATVGNTITGVLLQGLPAIGGDVSSFVELQPGVGPDGSVGGTVVDQSTFMLDGGNNSNDMDGSMQVYTPSFGSDPTGGVGAGTGLRGGASSGGVPTGVIPAPSDSVEEIKVNTANQTADFNSSAGAQVEIVTKRGTNAWHGTAYEYYLDNNFNANTWDNNASGTPLPSFHYNRFGGSVGGPLIKKEILGGKTYFFADYQGFRWNNTVTVERSVPSADMRAGILSFGPGCNSDSAANLANCVAYNLNPVATIQPSTGALIAPSGLDPRGLGIDPTVQALWALMPAGNDPSCGGIRGSRCDSVNEIGFKANVLTPQDDNFGVARLDHDFGSRWHFNSTYHFYKLVRATTSQTDLTATGIVSTSARPQQPWYFTASLTTNISSNFTNDFHYSYTRNDWTWLDAGGPPQLAGLGGALEPLGESSSALTPYNVDTQDIRTRFWDGHDNFIRDDLTLLKGNHLFTFGGAYQRNFDYHQRSDNGGGINYSPTYQLGDSSGAGGLTGLPSTPAGASTSTFLRDYSAVLGIVTDSQIAYTRSGADLALNPPLTKAFDKSTIPYYNVYWSDSWRIKPTLTLTYGLGWTLEMPPTEQNGKQIELVDSSGQQVDGAAYIKQREAAALNGQVYNPEIGFALVGNTGPGQKYPYDPFYGSFSPRVALAWSPTFDDGILGSVVGHGKTVVRGGYSRIYGRLNGVDLVLSPLLGTGLIQAVQCKTNEMPIGGNPATCASGGVTPLNAFRIGTDGNTAPIPAASATLPQPVYPGVNNVAGAAGEALDPHFRPNVVDSFDLTIQRQLTNKLLVEVGYIGRRITHEYQPVNLNAVPYMMTLGGQTFAKAYAAVELAMNCQKGQNFCGAAGVPTVAPQPFFEAALAGTGYCAGFANCTAAVVNNEFGNFQSQSVWSLWSDLDNGGFNFPRSMMNTPIDCPTGTEIGCNGQLTSGVADNESIGHGNYNAGFLSVRLNDWHGLTLQQNLTLSRSLGTGAVVQASSEYTVNDPFNLDNMYGVQPFDRTYVYNVFAVYALPIYKTQQGIIGHLAGGWSISPIFTAGSGLPLYCNTNSDAQAYGSGDGNDFYDNEQCIPVSGNTGGNSVHKLSDGSLNLYADPSASYANFRAPILGYDTRRDGGYGPTRGLPYWNLDMSLKKNIKISERYSLEFQFLCLNTLNHVVFNNPYQQLGDSGDWGVLNSQGNTPRQMEFGLHFKF